jgi:hypothetical protein
MPGSTGMSQIRSIVSRGNTPNPSRQSYQRITFISSMFTVSLFR